MIRKLLKLILTPILVPFFLVAWVMINIGQEKTVHKSRIKTSSFHNHPKLDIYVDLDEETVAQQVG